jgi:hypothetical protein
MNLSKITLRESNKTTFCNKKFGRKNYFKN